MDPPCAGPKGCRPRVAGDRSRRGRAASRHRAGRCRAGAAAPISLEFVDPRRSGLGPARHTFRNSRSFAFFLGGMSSITPPPWPFACAFAEPEDISNRSRISSRSRRRYRKIDTAPRSSALGPSQIRCEAMRLSSRWSHAQVLAAPRGASITEQRFSTAPQNAVGVEVVGQVVNPLNDRDHLPVRLGPGGLIVPVCTWPPRGFSEVSGRPLPGASPAGAARRVWPGDAGRS